MVRTVFISIGEDEFLLFRLPTNDDHEPNDEAAESELGPLSTASRRSTRRKRASKELTPDCTNGPTSTLNSWKREAAEDQDEIVEKEAEELAMQNFRRALKEHPPAIPPLFLRLLTLQANDLGNNSARKESAGKLKVALVVLEPENGAEESRYIVVDGRQKQISLIEHYAPVGRRSTGAEKRRKFAYDAVFGADDSLSEFCSCTLLEVLQYTMNGEDASVLSFGHVGEGYRNSFVGEAGRSQALGVIPCAIAWIFRMIAEKKKSSKSRFSVRVSAMEIYGGDERKRDLLSDVDTDDVDLSTCSELRASSLEKAAHYLDKALTSRNSRTEDERRNSHMIFTIHLYQYHATDGREITGGRSRLHLINLGSGEKCTRQGRTSLTLPAIGNVLLTLLQGQKHVPSKNSKLTQVLKETVGTSQCKYVSLLATVSSDVECYLETSNVVQISSRLYRLKRTRKSSVGGGQHPSGGESSCDDRMRRLIRRSASDPDCTTSSSDQSCETVIFMGVPGAIGNPMASGQLPRKYGRAHELPKVLPKRPSHLNVKGKFHEKLAPGSVGDKEQWIDGPKAMNVSQTSKSDKLPTGPSVSASSVMEQSRRERVEQWIAVQEQERHFACTHPSQGDSYSTAVVRSLESATPFLQQEDNEDTFQIANFIESRHLEDIAEVDEECSSDKHSEKYRKMSTCTDSPSVQSRRTNALLTGLTESISAAFSHLDGHHIKILSSEDADGGLTFDSISINGTAQDVEDDAAILSDEELERAMEASLSSVRSHEILQKLKAETQKMFVTSDATCTTNARASSKPFDSMISSASIYKSLSSTCKSDECRALASENCNSPCRNSDAQSSVKRPKPVAPVLPYQATLAQQSPVAKHPVGSALTTSTSYRDAVDTVVHPLEPVRTLTKSQPGKDPKAGSKVKKKEGGNGPRKASRSPLNFLRSGNSKQPVVKRTSTSPGRRTSSGYDSGSEDRSYAAAGKWTSPYSKVTQPKVNVRSSSGLGSENSSAVSSDPGSSGKSPYSPKLGALRRTTGGRLLLSSKVRTLVDNGHSTTNSSGYESTKDTLPKLSPSSMEKSPGQSPVKRWLLNLVWKGSKSAPQSPITAIPFSCVEKERYDRKAVKAEELRREQELLKVELKNAKDRLCVLPNKWDYDLHVLECMSTQEPGMLDALAQETKILRKRVDACKSHVQMITVFDSARVN